MSTTSLYYLFNAEGDLVFETPITGEAVSTYAHQRPEEDHIVFWSEKLNKSLGNSWMYKPKGTIRIDWISDESPLFNPEVIPKKAKAYVLLIV